MAKIQAWSKTRNYPQMDAWMPRNVNLIEKEKPNHENANIYMPRLVQGSLYNAA